tara:strand:+ start:129 stop:338 length:210 start_codon:yes stop_codon:yes gene_type:complete
MVNKNRERKIKGGMMNYFGIQEGKISFEDIESWLGEDIKYRAVCTLMEIANGTYKVENFKQDIENYKEE